MNWREWFNEWAKNEPMYNNPSYRERYLIENAYLAGRKANLDETAKDADAAMLYGSTARGHGFIGVPKWSELAEETKALYRNAIAWEQARGPKSGLPPFKSHRHESNK